MDKPSSTIHEFSQLTNSHHTVSSEKNRTYSVQRKPVPSPLLVYEQPKKPQYQVYTTSVPIHHRSHGPRRPQTRFSRLQYRWQSLSWRVRGAIIAGIVCLLVLIIGLSAGLGRRSRTTNLPLPTNHGGPYTGDLTYYDPALGACGLVNSGSDAICAVSHLVFDAVSTGSDPNTNPLCGKKIRARRDGKSIDLTVVDRCTGCKATDIDTTRSVFGQLANIDQGRVSVSWSWLEDVPDAAATAS